MIEPVLPDLLQPGLNLVFCGTAPGTVSAQRRQYYAHPQNKFWKTMHNIGLTPRQLDPTEYRLLIGFGIGLTDIAKNASGMDSELPPGSLGREAALALRERIEANYPSILAFTSLTGGRRVMGPKAVFGKFPEKIAQTEVWILPSPSPAAHWNWDERVWQQLGRRVNRL